MLRISLIVFFIFFSSHRANAIKCYSCVSGTGLKNACDNPDDATTSVECRIATLSTKVKEMYANEIALVTADEFVCYNLKMSSGNLDTIKRGCTFKSSKATFCEKSIGDEDGKMEYCGTCNTDLCNSSNGVHVQLFTSIACLFVALISSKFY